MARHSWVLTGRMRCSLIGFMFASRYLLTNSLLKSPTAKGAETEDTKVHRPDPDVLQDILAGDQVGIISFRLFADKTWKYLYISPSCEHLYGYPVAEFWAEPSFWMSRIHTDDISRFEHNICDRILAAESFSIEFRFRCQDDQFHWMSSHYGVRADVTERSWVVTTFTVDISDRKQAGTARDRLFDQTTVGLCVVDQQGRLRQMNTAFCALVGHPAAVLQDRALTHLLEPEDLPAALTTMARLKQGETVHQFDHPCRHRDGQTRRLSWTIVPDLEAGWFYGSVRDVTEVQKGGPMDDSSPGPLAAQTLRQYERMVSATADGMALVGPDYTYRVVNQAYCDRFHQGATDLVGKSVASVLGATLFEAMGRPRLEQALGGAVVTYQGWLDLPQGERCFMGVTFAPYYAPTGDITGVVVTSRDLTDLKRAEIALQQQAARETVLARITGTLQETLELHPTLDAAAAIIRQYFEADRALVYQLQTDGSGQVVAESVATGWTPMGGITLDESCLTMPNRIQAYLRGKVQNIADVETSTLHPCYLGMLKRHQVRANLVVPIIDGGVLWGLLGIQQCDRPRHWHEDDIDMLQQLSQKLTLAIRQAQLYERLQATNHKLEYLANHDALTRLPNRRYFMESLTQEWQRAIRSHTPLTLVLCDVDYFKRYNDTYGHVAGDRCLAQVATILQQAIHRSVDMVARYGGEEFVALLPNTAEDGAIAVVNAIQTHLTAAAIPHQASLVNDQVTLSFGIACHTPQPHDTSRTLLTQADTALYEAKQQGRNQYHVAAANGERTVPSGDRVG
jgi:diguanylate cyclase (GGDEF)-like protein/PAS domain S-box-containing protein